MPHQGCVSLVMTVVGMSAMLEADPFFSDDDSSSGSTTELPAPGKFGRPSEAEDWSWDERVERDAILALVDDQARGMLADDDLLFLRLVRGYWKYEDRTRTIAGVAEAVAAWRRDLGFDGILRRPLHATFHRECWPSWFLGHDSYGHPVVLERISDVDWDAIMAMSSRQLLRLRLQALEALQRECRLWAGPHRVYKTVYIIDVSGATFSLMNSKIMDFAKKYAKLTEQMYADAAWTNFVVNAPAVARAAWRIIERIVDEETRDIVRFVPVGVAGLNALLAAGLTLDVVPDYLGGSATPVKLVADLLDQRYEPVKDIVDDLPRIPPPDRVSSHRVFFPSRAFSLLGAFLCGLLFSVFALVPTLLRRRFTSSVASSRATAEGAPAAVASKQD